MNSVLINGIVSVATAIIAHCTSVKKSKKELLELKEKNKSEIEKLEKEMIAQAKLYESNAQTDLLKEFMKSPSVKNYIEREFKKQFKI